MAQPYYKPKYGHKYHRKVEESLQLRICNHLRQFFPEVIFRSDFSSGLYLTPGLAAKHARLQSGKGFPDITVFHPSYDGRSHGFLRELKPDGTKIYLTRGNRAGEIVADEHIREQARVHSRLRALGYDVDFSVGYEQFMVDFYDYMGRTFETQIELF